MKLSHLALWVALAAIALAADLRGGIFERLYILSKPYESWCFGTFGVRDGVAVYLATSWLALVVAGGVVGAIAFRLYDVLTSSHRSSSP